MKLSFTPLAFMRIFLGRCHCEESRHLNVYRRSGYLYRLIAFRYKDGTWYIRRKYRLIYSVRFLESILNRRR